MLQGSTVINNTLMVHKFGCSRKSFVVNRPHVTTAPPNKTMTCFLLFTFILRGGSSPSLGKQRN